MTLKETTNLSKDHLEKFLKQNEVQSLLALGPAGTGKSHLIRDIASNFDGNSISLALTGMAAGNVNGQTIHSYCGLRKEDNLDGPVKRKALRKKVGLIMIDEISCVPCELIEYLDRVLRVQNEEPDIMLSLIHI